MKFFYCALAAVNAAQMPMNTGTELLTLNFSP